jgi:hypothetical protein
MEIREAKAELKEYADNKRYIERKQEELEVLTERINKITASYSDMPKGGTSSREDLIAKKLDLEREMYGYLISLVEKKQVVERTIQILETRYRNILDFLYIGEPDEEQDREKRYNTLVEYAAQEKLSYRQATRLLKEAHKAYAEARGDI